MPNLDLSPVRYDRWVRVVFDHPPTTFDEDQNVEVLWGWRDGVDFDVSHPARLLAHFTRMCRDFGALSQQFTLPQLNQGIWLLLSAEIEFGKYLADEEISLSARLDCVHSMLIPFRDFVAQCEVEELENCFWMWWDLLEGAFWNAQLWQLKAAEMGELIESLWEEDLTREQHRERRNQVQVFYEDLTPDGRAVLDTMLETLLAIATLDDQRTESYALHGLGHLRHPEGSTWLQRYIDENHDHWDEAGLKWLEQCRDGTVM